MKPNPVRRPQNREQGTTFVMVTFFMVALFGFASLSIDVSHVFQEQRRAQIGSDAASYAAVALLTNSLVLKATVIAEAQNIATVNSLTPTEIAASSIGQIQVGRWNTNSFTFTPDATPFDAVRVPARRTVPLMFGRVVGIAQMAPAVDSISFLGSAGTVEGGRPFGITTNALKGVSIGSQFVVYEKQGQSGQWGQLNMHGQTGGNDWDDAMRNGFSDPVSVGDPDVKTDPGADKVKKVFDDLKATGESLIIPVVPNFIDVKGKTPVNIVGFIGVKVIDIKGGGSNIEITFKLVTALATGTPGGPPGSAFAKVRVLVK